MEGGWKTPPPAPQCYNETKKPSAYRVKLDDFDKTDQFTGASTQLWYNDKNHALGDSDRGSIPQLTRRGPLSDIGDPY